LLADDAVYRRTREGQHELVSDSHQLNTSERTFLGAFTGYTSLRVLLDLGLYSSGAAGVITRLTDLGLIELVEQSRGILG
jgi:hypothetical protein